LAVIRSWIPILDHFSAALITAEFNILGHSLAFAYSHWALFTKVTGHFSQKSANWRMLRWQENKSTTFWLQSGRRPDLSKHQAPLYLRT